MSGLMVSVMGKRFSSLFGQAFSFILGMFSKMFKKWKKKTMFLFLFLGHVLIVLASNVEMLYGGRILCGLCQGFCNCLTIVYVLEFCHNVKEMAICGVVLALIGKS